MKDAQAIGIIMIIVIVAGVFIGMQTGLIPSLLPGGSGTPTPRIPGGPTAYCSASANVTYTARSPAGCLNLPSRIVLNLLDLYTGKA